MQIIPTTNPQVNFNLVESRLLAIKEFSVWIQIDVTDGVLVRPATFPLELINRTSVDLAKNLFDIHLMVKEPINWLNKCFFVEASRIIGQVEMMTNRDIFISTIKEQGMEAGLAFDVSTPLDTNIPQDTDLILLMGRPMGFDPLPLDNLIYDRIKFFKDLGFKVALDGGVTLNNFLKLKDSGLDIIYSGQSYLSLYEKN